MKEVIFQSITLTCQHEETLFLTVFNSFFFFFFNFAALDF